jgi:hypothetical protein
MTLADVLAADMRALIADAPMSFTFDGGTYTGTRSGIATRKPLEIGGFQEEPILSIAINLADAYGTPTFTTQPDTGDTVIIGSTTYRIDRTEVDEFGVALQLDLVTPHK